MSTPLTAAALQALFDQSPFMSFAHLSVVSIDCEAGELTVRMPMRPEFERRSGSGQFHGGPIAALIDTVGDFAIGAALGGGVPTINFRVDYLRPALGAALTAKAKVRRAGKSVAVVDVDVFDTSDTLVAVGRGAYSAKRD